MGVLHMPTAAGHHPLKSCPRHEAPPQIILKSVTFTMTTGSPPRAPPRQVAYTTWVVMGAPHFSAVGGCTLAVPGLPLLGP